MHPSGRFEKRIRIMEVFFAAKKNTAPATTLGAIDAILGTLIFPARGEQE